MAAEEDGGLSFVSGEPFSGKGEYGEKLNKLTKFVASSKLEEAPWGGFPAATVTRDPVATIRELKEQDGKDIWLWGSLTLMHSLLAAGVVDEVRLLVCPETRGKGTRVFRGPAGPEGGRGHLVRERSGNPAVRGQEMRGRRDGQGNGDGVRRRGGGRARFVLTMAVSTCSCAPRAWGLPGWWP
ncbi:dihydrofolate reductase family protein [Amycolatopsis lurida]